MDRGSRSVCGCRDDGNSWGDSIRKHNLHLNWSNEVKNNRIDGGMHGKEWRRWIYVRKGSLWIFSLLFDCLSCSPANNNYVFFYFLFFEKHLGCLKVAFTLDVFPRSLKECFHPGIFLFFFSFFYLFFIIGPPHEVFNPKMGLRRPMEVFTWILILFSPF